jgi:hypothetical protein
MLRTCGPKIGHVQVCGGSGWVTARFYPACHRLDKPYNGNHEETGFWVIDGFILSPNIELVSIATA